MTLDNLTELEAECTTSVSVFWLVGDLAIGTSEVSGKVKTPRPRACTARHWAPALVTVVSHSYDRRPMP